MNNYEDIINLPHHTSKNHKSMSIQNRAAQFSPFSALTGYEAAIKETERITEEKKILEEDVKEAINENLIYINHHIKENITCEITYFKKDKTKSGGNYKTIIDIIKKIDTINKYITTKNNKKIPIEDIYQIIYKNT